MIRAAQDRVGMETDPDPARPAVELRAVCKNFGPVAALTDVNLTVRQGEFFSMLGASGCGKSTTLSAIGGFTLPSSGQILIDGKSVEQVPAYRRPVNTVFQNYALFPHMTVGENVAFGLKMSRVPPAERAVAVREVLKLVSLEGMEDRRPQQMSGGQRQRVALARALVNRPSVLLLDEPLGALDLKLRKQMQAELTELQRRVKITFIYVTHDQEEAMSMSDRIAVMDGGRVLQVGTPAEIYDDPADRKVMEFMGSPNTLSGKVRSADSQHTVLAIGDAGTVRVPTRQQVKSGEQVSLLVRPERVRLLNEKPQNSGVDMVGTISKISNVGFVIHYTIRLADGQELTSYRLNSRDEPDGIEFQSGDRAYLCWQEADGRVYS